MLKWWFEKYGASDIILSKRQFTKAAASQGELEVLKWLVENGFKYSADCLAAAAQGGELECIEYLREIGCPWSNAVAKIDMAADFLTIFDNGILQGLKSMYQFCDI